MSGLSEIPKMYLNGYLSSENGPLNYHAISTLEDGGGQKRVRLHSHLNIHNKIQHYIGRKNIVWQR